MSPRPIHVCGYCRDICTGDGSDEHVCDNDDCLSIHLPSPETLGRRTARHGGEIIDARRNYADAVAEVLSRAPRQLSPQDAAQIGDLIGPIGNEEEW